METAMKVKFDNLNLAERFEQIFKHPYSLGRYMSKAISIRKTKLYKIADDM